MMNLHEGSQEQRDKQSGRGGEAYRMKEPEIASVKQSVYERGWDGLSASSVRAAEASLYQY